MLIPILSNFANFLFFTSFLFVLETRLLILSFLESSWTERVGVDSDPSPGMRVREDERLIIESVGDGIKVT
jgi:hypothetical protein